MLQYGHIAAHLSSLGLQINNLTIRMPTLGYLVKKSIVCIFPQIKLFDQISHCMQSERQDYQFPNKNNSNKLKYAHIEAFLPILILFLAK